MRNQLKRQGIPYSQVPDKDQQNIAHQLKDIQDLLSHDAPVLRVLNDDEARTMIIEQKIQIYQQLGKGSFGTVLLIKREGVDEYEAMKQVNCSTLEKVNN